MKTIFAILLAAVMLIAGAHALADQTFDLNADDAWLDNSLWSCDEVSLEIAAKDGTYSVTIVLSQDTETVYEWVYHCKYCKSLKTLTSTDGQLHMLSYSNGSLYNLRKLSTEGSAAFTLTKEGKVVWNSIQGGTRSIKIFQRE